MDFNKKSLNHYILPALLLICLLSTPSCKQLMQAKRLADCDYSLLSVIKTKLAGIDIQNIDAITDLGLKDAAKLAVALTESKLPLAFTLNLGIENPNDNLAALNQLEWMAYIDDRLVSEGIINDRTEIPARGKAIMPINVAFDLKEVFSTESSAAILKIVTNYLGIGNNPTKVTLKIKPVLKVGAKLIKSPVFITVKTTV